MKNLIKKAATFALSATLVAGALSGCGAAKDATTTENGEASAEGVITIHAVTGASPRPFTFYGDDEQLTGHNIELVTAIFDKLPQYELVWEVTDFPSIFAGIDSGKYQIGVNNFVKNPEREEKYLFTDPTFANAYIVVTSSDIDLPDEVTLEALEGLNFIGQPAVNLTTIAENYNESNPDHQVIINYTEEDLSVQLQDIAAGKYDFTIIDKPMYFGYYQPEFGYDFKTANLNGYGVGDGLFSYLMIGKGNEQLVDDINVALKEVIEDGTSKEICEKYFGDDYSPSYN